ncbi:hypothetical protein N7517_002970, partial [Penicillium concentricum]
KKEKVAHQKSTEPRLIGAAQTRLAYSAPPRHSTLFDHPDAFNEPSILFLLPTSPNLRPYRSSA